MLKENPQKISIVIPCYNEAGNIEEMYRRLNETLSPIVQNYELIFVDDYSTDNSRAIMKKLAGKDKRVVLLFFSRNFGHSQYGLTAGCDYSTGDAVVWIEGDLQDPPELIAEFILRWRQGYDVVYGLRTKRKGSLFLRACYKIFYVVFSKLSSIKVPKDAGDFSLLDRKVVNIIRTMPERDRYMRGLRAWTGFQSIGVPYTRDARFEGKSSNNLVSNIKWAKKAIFSFSYAPIECIFYLALLAFIAGVLAFIVYFLTYFFGNPPRGFSTLLLITILFGSVQLLSLSIIAEYISRIFEEVKGRPQYIIEEVVNDPRK